MYIYLLCNLRIIRFEDGNFSPFREIESRESAIFLSLTINDNRSKLKKEFESRKGYLSTTRSPLPPKKRIHPSFLFSPTTPPFSNACRSKSPAPDIQAARYIEAANKRVRKLAQKSPASLSLRLLDSNQGLRVPIRDSHCAWVYREYEPQGREKERERERGEWIFSLSPSPRNAPTKSTGGGDDNDKDDYDYDDYDSYSTRRERHLSRPIMRDSLISRLHGSTACTTACFLCQHARHPPLF